MTSLFVLLACAGPPTTAAPSGRVVLVGAQLVGRGVAALHVEDGLIVAVGDEPPEDAQLVDLTGAWIAPAFIDSHVHLAYWDVAAQLPAAGVAGAVDLAAPLEWLGSATPGLTLRASGPMVTATGGYPTQGWGRGGYGLECADAAEAEAAVTRLAEAGAALIKLPVTSPPVLDEAALVAAVARARALGLRVVTHALGAEEAALARAVGVDALVHAPTVALDEDTVRAWAGGAVIPTLDAFGGGAVAVDNLRRLREAGAEVLYGTDLGNSRVAGISERELAKMMEAGMDGEAILRSATEAPAAWWGMDELGALAPGRRASFLVLDADPLDDPLTLARPREVWVDGVPAP